MKRNVKYFMLFLAVVLVVCTYNIQVNYKTEYSKDEEVTKVTIWNLQGGSTDALHEVVKGYEDIYPNVKFVINDYENQVYKNIIKDILVTNEGPDIFFSWGFEFLSDFVEGDIVLDITEEVKKRGYNNVISDEKLRGFTFDNKVYGLPVQGFNTVLYINENMFNYYGVKIPNTYEELLLAINKFNSNGVTPISIGGQEDWLLSFLYMTLAVRENGIDEVQKMFETEKYFESEGFLEAANKFVELINKNAFGNDFVNKTINQAAYEFCNNESAMLFCGSFNSNSIQEINPEFSNEIKVIPFPVINDKSNLFQGVAGYTDTFVINKYTENKELVLDIYMRLIKDLSEKLVHEKGNGLPVLCDKDCKFDDEKLIYKCLEVFPTDGYHEPYDIVLSKELTDIHLTSLADLAKGNITAEEFIKRQKNYK